LKHCVVQHCNVDFKGMGKNMITDLLYIVALYLVSICSLLGCLDLLFVKYLHVKIDRYLHEVRKRL